MLGAALLVLTISIVHVLEATHARTGFQVQCTMKEVWGQTLKLCG